MIKPLHYETEHLLIHPFRPEELEKFEKLAIDIFEILSDEQTLTYIPQKRLHNLQEAELFLQTMVMNYHAGLNFLHFISDKNQDKVIGLIDLISPKVARQHYRIDIYPFFIEFYLGASATGCYIMTEILPPVIDNLLSQGITSIGAVVNRSNTAARKVLEKAQFSYKAPFDVLQDLYEIA
ncbi:Protein N-acetyltransferase, RimJ/RimL family [Pedobacter suwonensis]|uniref:Protein N-acetyltransferase, RimJ/RimL family n=1 Tax=Pedobacter suwonensis TaxID=332999 RepID=A0A1I0SQ46_9SPHI|nr:GNAT family N-acetyltransferase [Pedobacter suwonensis]SFA41537.1 Protein N-acetyltransferase, RimJ/RimL family [Pedobacter suwonensis]